MTDRSKQAILISGMHRSGTAAASRALSFLGYAQPRLLTEAGPGNPTGFWQPTRIVQINEEMIGSLGWSWDHTPLLSQPAASLEQAEADILAHLASTWTEKAREAIRDSYRPDAARIVCKDPRISLFPSFWQAAFEAEGFSVRHVVAFRDPLEVANSLRRTASLGRGPALRAWLAYNLRPLSSVEVAAAIDYRDLIAKPVEAVNHLARVMGEGELDAVAAAELESFIDRDHSAPEASGAEEENQMMPRLFKQTFELLRHWRDGPTEQLHRRAVKLRSLLTDAQLLFGRVRRLPPLATASVYQPAAPRLAPARGPRRSLVLHYHLFKNAGTSVDVVLEGNFGEDWREQEFVKPRGQSNLPELTAWITQHPGVKALSSHTALGPLPTAPGVTVAPVIFVRHPIDRIRSAYEFERRQRTETRGAKLAKEVDFAGYVEHKLSRRDRQCRNFQTFRFAAFGGAAGSERQRALNAVAVLPFVGLVEDFGASMARMETYLQGHFPEFRAFGARENAWREGATLRARLARVREDLGEALWLKLLEANADDFVLFDAVLASYDLTQDAILDR